MHKSHDLLQEEVVITVYNMAAVDFDTFYAKFLPHFLTNFDGLDDNQKHVLVQNFKIEKVGSFLKDSPMCSFCLEWQVLIHYKVIISRI